MHFNSRVIVLLVRYFLAKESCWRVYWIGRRTFSSRSVYSGALSPENIRPFILFEFPLYLFSSFLILCSLAYRFFLNKFFFFFF